MLQQDFCRYDYKEFLQLALLYLKGQSSSTLRDSSGAIHYARWMPNILTYLKLLLIENNIKSDLQNDQIFKSKEHRKKIHQFVYFVILLTSNFGILRVATETAKSNSRTFQDVFRSSSRTFPELFNFFLQDLKLILTITFSCTYSD